MSNHVLIVGPPHSRKLTILRDVLSVDEKTIKEQLVGRETPTHSGLIFNEVPLSTKYYDTKINVWVDEFDSDSVDSMEAWCSEFLSDEYKEIRDVLQGIVFTVGGSESSRDPAYLNALIPQLEAIDEKLESEFIEAADDDLDEFQWPGFKLVVVSNSNESQIIPSKADVEDRKARMLELEDQVLMARFDFVDFDSEKKANEYGDKLGKVRLSEIFITNEWKVISKKIAKGNNKIEAKQTRDSSKAELLRPLLSESTGKPVDNEGSELEIDQLDKIIEKLRKAKLDVSEISLQEDKEKYVNSIVSDIMKQL